MLTRCVGVILLCLLVRALAADSNRPAPFTLSDVLPEGRCQLEVMAIHVTGREEELGRKVLASVATNRDWFLEHVRGSAPGAAVRYDQRLGLTKGEYAEYLDEISKRSLVLTGKFLRCTFRRKGNELSLDVGDQESPLRKIRLNLASGELCASVGKIGYPTWRSSNALESSAGGCDGYSWTYEKSDPKALTVRMVKLNIYCVRSTGKILWQFKDSGMVRKQISRSFEIFFQHAPRHTE